MKEGFGLQTINQPQCADEGTQSPRSPLTARQLRWVAFHLDSPEPYRWAWRRANHGPVRGAPETWRILKAWKRVSGRVRTTSIRDTDREACGPYFDGFPRVNAAGRALIEAAQAGTRVTAQVAAE